MIFTPSQENGPFAGLITVQMSDDERIGLTEEIKRVSNSNPHLPQEWLKRFVEGLEKAPYCKGPYDG